MKSKMLYLLRKEQDFALFSIDSEAKLAIICYQGNPVESPRNKLLCLPLDEARKEWKCLSENNWSVFEKGIVPGAVMQRIMAWIKAAKKISHEYEQDLQVFWKSDYDGITPAQRCRVENNEGATKFFVIKSSDPELREGFALHPRMGVGANQGWILSYIPGTIPKQRGRKMR